jgi:hypothetical protein
MRGMQIIIAMGLMLAIAGSPARAQDDTERELERYRKMLADDPWSNPAMLDADRGVMLAFELVDPDGERTTILFSNIRLNGGMSDDALQLGAPAGTKIVRPISTAMPSK